MGFWARRSRIAAAGSDRREEHRRDDVARSWSSASKGTAGLTQGSGVFLGIALAQPKLLGCETAFPTELSHFRHFSPEVPDSPHIGAYPCIFHFQQPSLAHQKSAANEGVLATPLSSPSLDRTQEVGGSNPPSSIGRSPCTSATCFFAGLSNRLRSPLLFRH